MELNISQFVRPVALLIFLGVYILVFIVGVSIFYHIRWFGLKGDKMYKRVEILFIVINLIIFTGNLVLLGTVYLG